MESAAYFRLGWTRRTMSDRPSSVLWIISGCPWSDLAHVPTFLGSLWRRPQLKTIEDLPEDKLEKIMVIRERCIEDELWGERPAAS